VLGRIKSAELRGCSDAYAANVLHLAKGLPHGA
jgi:hypothetical protein